MPRLWRFDVRARFPLRTWLVRLPQRGSEVEMQSRRFLYICDDRFYHRSGSWHTSNGFPLRAIAESCAATGVHIASWTFFGRLSDGPPPVGALPIDAPPNTEVTVI